jgi:colanic acid/amylovoran biosynthesis glycosyltransferase
MKASSMPGPRVAYILLWFPEPSQTFILDEVNTLVRLGLDLRVYTLYGARPAGRVAGMGPAKAPVAHLGLGSLAPLAQEMLLLRRHRGADGVRFLARVLARRWRCLETAAEAGWAALAGVHLARRFQAEGITHIHAPWADGPATAAWVASRLSGIPFSFCGHARDIYPPDGALEEKLAAATMARVISEVNRGYLAGLVPAEAHKLVKISIGAPLAPEPRPRLRSGPPFRLLALGRLVVKKGFAVLLESCRLLAAAGVDFRLTLAGDGPERRHLQALVRRQGLEGRVELPGFVPHREVSELLREAHLFIMPSVLAPSGDRDGIPTVILEALLHEVPVVASGLSGIPEAIHPGETGWLAPPGDSRALAQAIQEALAAPEEARRRARAGRELVFQEFNSRKNYGELKACFERISRRD